MERPSSSVNYSECELHLRLRETMRMCRLAGFFPVDGVTSTKISSLRFTLRLPYLLIYPASVFGQILLTGFNIFWFFINTVSLETLSYTLFYLISLIATFLLFKLAHDWKELMLAVMKIEKKLLELRTSSRNELKYAVITYTVMFLALVEHVMSISSKLSKSIMDLNESNITSKVLEEYFKTSAPFMFNLTPYSHWKAVIYTISTLQATFIWNITDVMTMCISLYLSSFFHDINHIIHIRERNRSFSWEKVRVFYSQSVALVKEVDSRLCYLVLLSFFTNIFFICLQFFYSLKTEIPKHNNIINFNYTSSTFHRTIHMIYYVYSFAFLMTRATAMCLLAANVHKAAQEPQFVVGYVSSSEYTLNVQRFNRQIRYTTTAISGVYFYVTRNTLLKVAGTFLTYELVLLQFNLEGESKKFRNENYDRNRFLHIY